MQQINTEVGDEGCSGGGNGWCECPCISNAERVRHGKKVHSFINRIKGVKGPSDLEVGACSRSGCDDILKTLKDAGYSIFRGNRELVTNGNTQR
jgi:hypothetical protein